MSRFKSRRRNALIELLEQADKLQQQRGRVTEATLNALHQGGRQRRSQVERWLAEVKKVSSRVNELEGLYAKSRSSLSSSIFCCFKSRGKMTEKLRELYATIKSLMEEPKHDSQHGLAPPKSRPISGEEPILGLESAFHEVWSFIADGEVPIIGIHGPGGVGKTTLLKQVYHALMDKVILDFDQIIWVKVPGDSSLKKLQDTIWEALRLSDPLRRSDEDDEKKNEIRSVSAIFNALSGKRFVIMLDGLRKPVDLEKIGVPLSELHQSNSKILFTTRFSKVCDGMKAKTFPLETLSAEEALFLLKKVVGDDIFDQNPSLFGLCADIIKACGHLPYAIVTVGRALRGRRHEKEWKQVLLQLTSASSRADMKEELSRADIEEDKPSWFAPLKLTYESLSSETMKKCFLYCSLLPEGYRIDKDQLVDFWIAKGFMEEVNGGMADRRYEGYGIIEKLVDACLLEKEANFITMHQLVRDISLMIASEDREEGKYFVKAGVELYEVAIDQIPKEAVKISLMQSLLTELPPSPPWHQVSTLFLSGNKFKEIPGDFFSNMPSLQVLDLSNSEIEELPETISRLEQLRYLNLSQTKLRSLYISLQNLRKLEILYLSCIDGLHFIPRDLFVWLQSLRLLNMYHCGHQNWTLLDEKKKADLLIGGEAFLKELESLSKLENLEISINGDPALKKFESSVTLQNCVSSVSIGGCETSTVSAMPFKNLRILEVSSCPKLLNFEIDWPGMEATTSAGISGQTYFNNLQHVKIECCWSLKELSWLCFAPNLQILHVEECINLKELIARHGGQVADTLTSTFFSLKRLYLHNLPSLTCVSNLPLPFFSLEEISVYYCPMLKQLPINMENALRALPVIKGEEQWFDELQWDDDKTKNSKIKNSFSPYFIPI